MAKLSDKLTEPAVKALKPAEAPIKVSDGKGLHLLVTPAGGKLWRLAYRYAGKQKLLALGVYPDVSLKDARAKRDTARLLLDQGKDPSEVRRAQKVAQKLAAAESFKAVAEEWLPKQRLAPATLGRVRWLLDSKLYPWLGHRPVADITVPEILAVLRRLEAAGHHESCKRARSVAGRVFRYAVATGRASRDPTRDLLGALTPPKAKNFGAVTDPKDLGKLLRAIDGYSGTLVVRCALKLTPYLFVRPGELRAAEWSEIDLDTAEWRIPAERMKRRIAHIVPLSSQAVEVFRELQPLTGQGRLVFPGHRSPRRPMSMNTVNAALRTLGYTGDEVTAHGFRATATTLLNELGFDRDVIERQMAHVEGNKVRAAYHRAQYLPERRQMMQAWADYLDSLRDGANIVPINSARKPNPASAG